MGKISKKTMENLREGLSRGCEYTGTQEVVHETFLEALEEVQQYRAIGTPEECRQAIEKQRVKKPIQITSTKKDGKIGKCPCCESIIGEDMIWCDDCGQKLDWGGEE